MYDVYNNTDIFITALHSDLPTWLHPSNTHGNISSSIALSVTDNLLYTLYNNYNGAHNLYPLAMVSHCLVPHDRAVHHEQIAFLPQVMSVMMLFTAL